MGRKDRRHHQGRDTPLELPPAVREALGGDAGHMLHALRGEAPVSIRRNPQKPVRDQGTPVPWCGQGRYLEERPVFTLDPLYHAGAYYAQEASSMLLEQALGACGNLPTDAVVLDLCAAPGGKATHLAAMLPRNALLICNEPVRARQAALTENLWKWGRPDTIITGSLPEAFSPLGPFCDLVLVDAPCSGEGMFRKDPFARAQWSEGLVESCAARQQGILDGAWAALKPGGALIYSTCTWEARENEDQLQRLIARGADPVPVPVEESWGVEATSSGLRCYPHRVRGEGFFIAVLRKPGADVHGAAPHVMARREGAMNSPFPDVAAWLDPGVQASITERDGVLHALASEWSGLLRKLALVLRVVAPGIPVAGKKGAAWVPHAALALNEILDQRAFPALDLGREELLRYLRGEALPATAAKGTVLVRCEGLGMGWAHGAGRRWNNRWPAPWRIRMR